MKTYFVELITNEVVGNQIKITCNHIKKIDYENIEADGVIISVGENPGMSFADIEDEEGFSILPYYENRD